MKLSTKGRYGARFMLDLAFHFGNGLIFLKDIATRQEISEKYLWHLVPPLKNAGLVNSTRGAKGGYELARPPSQITLLEIISVLEGSIFLTECANNPEVCTRADECATTDIWREVTEKISQTLAAYTLEDMVEKQKKKSGASTYAI